MKFAYFTLAFPTILAFESVIPSAFGPGNAPESADFISQWTDSQPQGPPPAAPAAKPEPSHKNKQNAKDWYKQLKPEAGKPWSSALPKAPGAWSGPNSHRFEGYSGKGLWDPSYFQPSQGSMGDGEEQILDLGKNKEQVLSAQKEAWKQKYNQYQAAIAAGVKPDTYLLSQSKNQHRSPGNPTPNSAATPRPGGNPGYANRPILPSLTQLSSSTRPSNYLPSRPLPANNHGGYSQPYPQSNNHQIPPYVQEQYGSQSLHSQMSSQNQHYAQGSNYHQAQPDLASANNGENYLMKSLLITALQKIFENQQAAQAAPHHQMRGAGFGHGFRPGFARPPVMAPAIAHPPVMAAAPVMAPVIPQAPAAVIGGPLSNPELGPLSDPEGLDVESEAEGAPVVNHRVKNYKSFKQVQEELEADNSDDEEHDSYRPYTKDEELAAQDGYQSYHKN